MHSFSWRFDDCNLSRSTSRSFQSNLRSSRKTLSSVFLVKTSRTRWRMNSSAGDLSFSCRGARSGGLHWIYSLTGDDHWKIVSWAPDNMHFLVVEFAVDQSAARLACASWVPPVWTSDLNSFTKQQPRTMVAILSLVCSVRKRNLPQPSSIRATFSTLAPVKSSRKTLKIWRIVCAGTMRNFTSDEMNAIFCLHVQYEVQWKSTCEPSCDSHSILSRCVCDSSIEIPLPAARVR